MNSKNQRDAAPGFSEMLSSLPDAEPALPPSPAADAADSRVIAAGNYSDMFSALPDAESQTTQSQTAGVRDVASARPVGVPFATRVKASAQRASAERMRRPAAGPAGSPPAPSVPLGNVGRADEIDSRTISQQIMEHLEQYNLLATCQLRLEVHNGVVVALGEVPGAYEKQLVAHFCRKVEGVVKYVDSLNVRQKRVAGEGTNRATARHPPRQPIEWRLPFRAWHAAAALGLVVLVWAQSRWDGGRAGLSGWRSIR